MSLDSGPAVKTTLGHATVLIWNNYCLEHSNSVEIMTNRIDETFKRLKQEGKSALAPFVTVGFPDVQSSEDIAVAIVDAGADLLELGIPFSDPLADGPTIQMTSYRALEQGVSLSTSLQMLRNLRSRGVEVPLVFMGYYNPFLHYGLERFVSDAVEAGIDGVIVPDMPTEESGEFKAICEKKELYVIPLLAPTSTDQRIADACKDAKGFIYCVGLTGVTGARRALATGLSDMVSRIRKHTDLPVMVGFGVSQPEHVQQISEFADGAIVASAFLDAIDKASESDRISTAVEFVKNLKQHES